jgi:hypothetical protein
MSTFLAVAVLPKTAWSLGLLWLAAALLFGAGFVMCGNVVAVGPTSPAQRSAVFQAGRMVMLVGLLTAVAVAVTTLLALVS